MFARELADMGGMTLRAPPWVGRAVAVTAIAGAVLLGVWALVRLDRSPRTHDAFLYADSAGIAPEVSGRLVALHVHENQRVTMGQPLVEIDREPFELHLEQARAQVAALEAQIDLTSRQVASQSSGAQAATTQIQGARSQLALARDTVMRLSPLLDKGYTTPQQVDEALANERSAQATLTAAIQQAQQAREAVGDTDSLRAQLANAEAAVTLAERDLRHTVVRAPFDGLVAGLDTAEGAYATTGQPIFTLIKANEWYAVGNFRETELPSIGIGDPATVWVVGSKNRSVHGRVESVGWGVKPEDVGAPGLPNVGRTLEWVIVAQRFPVRVRLDQVPDGVARIGATANILVSHGAGR
jgi:multidrug efflux system membrane fusion protein